MPRNMHVNGEHMEQHMMKAAVFMEPGVMEVREVPCPAIEKSTDAIVRVLKACVRGSDLWWFRGKDAWSQAHYCHEPS